MELGRRRGRFALRGPRASGASEFNPLARVLAAVGAVFSAVLAMSAAAATQSDDPFAGSLTVWLWVIGPDTAAAALAVLLGASCVMLVGRIRARVVLTADEMVVVNAMTSHWLPWPQIREVREVRVGFAWRTQVVTTSGWLWAWGTSSPRFSLPLPLNMLVALAFGSDETGPLRSGHARLVRGLPDGVRSVGPSDRWSRLSVWTRLAATLLVVALFGAYKVALIIAPSLPRPPVHGTAHVEVSALTDGSLIVVERLDSEGPGDPDNPVIRRLIGPVPMLAGPMHEIDGWHPVTTNTGPGPAVTVGEYQETERTLAYEEITAVEVLPDGTERPLPVVRRNYGPPWLEVGEPGFRSPGRQSLILRYRLTGALLDTASGREVAIWPLLPDSSVPLDELTLDLATPGATWTGCHEGQRTESGSPALRPCGQTAAGTQLRLTALTPLDASRITTIRVTARLG